MTSARQPRGTSPEHTRLYSCTFLWRESEERETTVPISPSLTSTNWFWTLWEWCLCKVLAFQHVLLRMIWKVARVAGSARLLPPASNTLHGYWRSVLVFSLRASKMANPWSQRVTGKCWPLAEIYFHKFVHAQVFLWAVYQITSWLIPREISM